MPYSVCISSVFPKLSPTDAMKAVKAAGGQAYEFWTWWDKDLQEMARLQRELGLVCAGFCSKFIPMNVPQRRAEFLEGLKQSLEAARVLDARVLIAQAGQSVEGTSHRQQMDEIHATLLEARPLLEDSGVILALEPLNTKIDHKGYVLDRAADAFTLINSVNHKNIRVLYDIYHQFITENSPVQDILDNLDLIAHIHLAGSPGRNEPWLQNDIPYEALLKAIHEAGYQGLIGLEYKPATDDPLGQLKRYLSTVL